MQINVNELKNEPDGKMSFEWEIQPPADFEDKLKNIVVSFSASYADESVLIKGTLTMKYYAMCSRCLRNIQVDIQENFEEEFKRGVPPEPQEPEIVLEKEDLSVDYFTGNCLELGDYFRQVTILSVPEKVLCHEDCPGLCPSCGKDLSVSSCKCQGESIDPRLKELEKFKEIINEN